MAWDDTGSDPAAIQEQHCSVVQVSRTVLHVSSLLGRGTLHPHAMPALNVLITQNMTHRSEHDSLA